MTTVNPEEKLAMRVSINSIIINFVLAIIKLAAGIIANSSALVSDAIHSVSDVFSTFIVIIGVKISNKSSDSLHQYGHERLECVAAIVLAIMLALTGLGIGYASFYKILDFPGDDLQAPGLLALVVALISILTKEGMFWYTKKAAETINSGALMADAWHHRSDALSSIGSFVGIFAARMGFPILDPLAGLLICLMVIYAAYEIFIDAINKMVDKSCDEETLNRMLFIISREEGVEHVDSLQTRIFGNKIYVDVEISVDDNLTLLEAHEISERVHLEIEKNFVLVKHCMVHVNPCSEKNHK